MLGAIVSNYYFVHHTRRAEYLPEGISRTRPLKAPTEGDDLGQFHLQRVRGTWKSVGEWGEASNNPHPSGNKRCGRAGGAPHRARGGERPFSGFADPPGTRQQRHAACQAASVQASIPHLFTLQPYLSSIPRVSSCER